MVKGNIKKTANRTALEFEAQFWATTAKMRGYMLASEYKSVCLGLIFFKYISDVEAAKSRTN